MAKPQDVQRGRQWVRQTGQPALTALVTPADCPRCRGRRHYDLRCPREPALFYWRVELRGDSFRSSAQARRATLVSAERTRQARLPRSEEEALLLKQAQSVPSPQLIIDPDGGPGSGRWPWPR